MSPETWTIFPLAQAIAHDKTVLLHHDLGQFITNDQVLSWSLGLGYSLSYRLAAAALAQDVPREWLAWLDRLQKSVCARYIGEPLADFSHDRAPSISEANMPLTSTFTCTAAPAITLGHISRQTVRSFSLRKSSRQRNR